MKIGVLQGRLTPPIKGLMQEFPENTWEKEFVDSEEVGLCGIEWLITKNNFKNNPFFEDAPLPKNILSVCVDNVVDKNFYKKSFLNDNLVPVLDIMISKNILNLVFPLLEDSSVNEKKVRDIFIDNISPISEKYKSISFCFEFESDKEIAMEVVSKRENFFITYDTGNFTSHYKEKVNHTDLINFFGDKIKNVHIKDRTYDGVTREVGLGDTDLKSVFKTLKNIGYNGNCILQLCRGVSGEEKKYIKESYRKIKNNYIF